MVDAGTFIYYNAYELLRNSRNSKNIRIRKLAFQVAALYKKPRKL